MLAHCNFSIQMSAEFPCLFLIQQSSQHIINTALQLMVTDPFLWTSTVLCWWLPVIFAWPSLVEKSHRHFWSEQTLHYREDNGSALISQASQLSAAFLTKEYYLQLRNLICFAWLKISRLYIIRLSSFLMYFMYLYQQNMSFCWSKCLVSQEISHNFGSSTFLSIRR